MDPHHHGLLHRAQVLRPDVQYLAVLVFHPVAARPYKSVCRYGGHLRTRADRTPDLSVLYALPRLNGLGQFETFRLGVGHTEESESVAIFEAAQFSALHLDYWRVQVRRRRSGSFGGLRL